MDFEIYKEQFIEAFNTYKGKLEDNSTYIQIKERYENLPPQWQKTVIYVSVFLVSYFIYSIPASFVSSADDKMEFFEENRQLTRDLIRAGRIAKTVQLPPPAPSVDSLKSQMDAKLTQERVLPEQKTSTSDLKEVAAKSIVPKSIKQSGVKASMKQLNLKQVVKLGESFNKINGTKLMNLAIQADAKDPHYFNADYEVALFSVPQIKTENDSSKKKKSKYGRSKNKKKSKFSKKKKK